MEQEKQHPFLEALDKKIRNLNKKLKEISELQDKLNQGQELKQEQQDKINQKKNINSQIANIEQYRTMFFDSIKDQEKKIKQDKQALLKQQQKLDQEHLKKLEILFEGLKIDSQNLYFQQIHQVYNQILQNPSEELSKYLDSDLSELILKETKIHQQDQEKKVKEVQVKNEIINKEVQQEEIVENAKNDRNNKPRKQKYSQDQEDQKFTPVGKVSKDEQAINKPRREPYKKTQN